jgi:hypothetical protein
MLIRQWMQKDAFNHCEHRSVCADSQGQSYYRQHGKTRRLAQLPRREADLLEQHVHSCLPFELTDQFNPKKKAALASLPIQISTG